MSIALAAYSLTLNRNHG